MIFGDMFLGVDTTFSPLGTPCAPQFPPVEAEGHQYIHAVTGTGADVAGVEAEEVPPEEDGPDADFAGAPLLGGGDEDEWETWCTDRAPGAAE